MKKIAIILLSVALVFSCAFIAFADPDPTPDYSITITDAAPGETYRAFKIFDASFGTMPSGAVSGSASDAAFAYTITPASQWWSVVTTPTTGTVDTTQDHFTVDGLTFTRSLLTEGGQPVYNVTRDGDHTATENATFARNFANKLYGALNGKTTPYSETAPAAVAPATKSSVEFDISDPGYYFVTTSVGSLCILDTNNTAVSIADKNDVPSIDKKISKNGTSSWSDGTINASIGDSVYFQIEVTDGKGTNQAITVTDQMTDGIALKYDANDAHDITVTVDGTEVAAGENTYSVLVTNEHRFVIIFAASYVTTLTEDSTVLITYTGVVTENAVIKGTTDDDPTDPQELFNTNTVTLTYSNQTSTDQVGVETYEFDVAKTTSETYQERLLNGATFKLYGSETGNDEIGLVLAETIYEVDPETGDETTTVKSRVYRVAVAGETPVTTFEAGLATIQGLGNGTYWVEEVEAPEGYNKLQTRESITLNGNNSKATFLANGGYDDGGMQVINRTGAELPSTGGIGTYLFYGIGAILVVGAVVVLVSKKRMRAYSE